MSLAAVLFDLDGVLVDSEPVYDRLTRELLAELGAHPPPQLFHRLRGLRAEDEWAVVVAELALDLSPRDLAVRAERCRWAALVDGPDLPAIPGARRLVDALLIGEVPVAVVSSSPTDRVRAMLGRLGFVAPVGAVVGGDAVARGKPHPDGYLAAAAALGVDPSSCVVVEDSVRGLDAGFAAGAACVHVTTGAPHPRAALAVPDLTAVTVGTLRTLVSCRG